MTWHRWKERPHQRRQRDQENIHERIVARRKRIHHAERDRHKQYDHPKDNFVKEQHGDHLDSLHDAIS